MKARNSLKYVMTYNTWKLFLECNSPQILSNLIPLTVLLLLWSFTPFYSKLRAIKWQKNSKDCLTS